MTLPHIITDRPDIQRNFDALRGEEWHIVSAFGTGFSAYGGGFSEPAYMRDELGFVHLKGHTNNASAVANTTAIFTLPVGYRPKATAGFAASGNNAFGVLRVEADGDVKLAVGDTTFIALDGITFRAEA